MSSDVVLTAAMRTNLLSLQNTQSVIDLTQNRLATGRKVNSALDNPQSFFASQALNNRASDLTRLLDSIGQSIQVIQAADNGITALTKLVEQADSIASQAQDALAQGTAEAKVTGNVDLRGIDDLSTVTGWSAGATLTLISTDGEGDLVDTDAVTAGVQSAVAVAITAGTSTNEMIVAINEIRDASDNSQVYEAKLNDKGQLEIRSLNGGNYRAQITTTANTDAADLALANALGFGTIARSVGDQTTANTTTVVEFTAIANVALTSFSLYDNTDPLNRTVAQRSDLLSTITRQDGTALFTGLAAASDYTIAVNGQGRQAIDLHNGTTAVTIQDFIDDINNNTTLNTKIEASFDDATGQVIISAKDASVTSVEIGLVGAAGTANFGFGQVTLTAPGAAAFRENIQLGAAAGQLAKLENDFNKIRDQIDLLVEDTGYRGTNLLKGDDLLTVFNEFRTSSITTSGVEFTASGLGIEEADFSRAASVNDMLGQVRSALEAVRDFGTTLANDLSVIQTRQTFTTELINTLKAGSDALTVADQNEEGAKLLALQTRQQLGVTSLSLASQSQQSILRLF